MQGYNGNGGAAVNQEIQFLVVGWARKKEDNGRVSPKSPWSFKEI
jgi:hypothetical protein